MDVINLARRVDAVLGVVLLLLALVFFAKGAYAWSGLSIVSSAVSFASAKYVPARWLVKRVMLARLK